MSECLGSCHIMQAKQRAIGRDEGAVEQLLRHQSRPAAVAIADGNTRRHAIQRHRIVEGMEALVNLQMEVA